MGNIGIEHIIFLLLAGLLAVAAITCMLEKKHISSLFMSFTAIVLVGTVAMAAQL